MTQRGRLVSWLRYRALCLLAWRQEWGCGWSIATSRACEQSDGHRWSLPREDPQLGGWWRICSRCGTGEPLAETIGTGSGPGTTTLYLHSTSATGNLR